MTSRHLLVALCLGSAVVLLGLFLALGAYAALTAARRRRLPLVTARVVGHEPTGGARDRAGHQHWRTVVAWRDQDGREVRRALEAPPLEPGMRWLRVGEEVRLHADPVSGRAFGPGQPARTLRSSLLVGAVYLLLPAVVLAVVGALLAG